MSKRAGIILYNDSGDVLLVKGLQSKKWGFPKGKSENRETYLQTAIRETKEETGLDVNITNLHTMVKYGNIAYFICSLRDVVGSLKTKPQIEEISLIYWASEKEVISLSRRNVNISLWKYIKNLEYKSMI